MTVDQEWKHVCRQTRNFIEFISDQLGMKMEDIPDVSY